MVDTDGSSCSSSVITAEMMAKELEKIIDKKKTPKSLTSIVQLVLVSVILLLVISTINLVLYQSKNKGALNNMQLLSHKLYRAEMTTRLLNLMLSYTNLKIGYENEGFEHIIDDSYE